MRKVKVYFGRNKNINQYGKTTNKPESVWAVPRLLRKYFDLQLSRYFDIQQLKLRMNGVVGARAVPTAPPADSEFFGKLLEERRQLKQKFMSGNF